MNTGQKHDVVYTWVQKCWHPYKSEITFASRCMNAQLQRGWASCNIRDHVSLHIEQLNINAGSGFNQIFTETTKTFCVKIPTQLNNITSYHKKYYKFGSIQSIPCNISVFLFL